MGSQRFKPLLIILVEPRFVIIDEDGCGNVHGVDEAQPFKNAAFPHALFHLGRDVDECSARRCVKPKFLTV